MRRQIFTLVLASLAIPALSQQPAPHPAATLRSILLEQLHASHNKPQWYTPVNTAIAGLTPEQARWVPTNAAGKSDSENNHSVGMLTYHLVFWNENALHKLQGHPDNFQGKNDETFNNFNAAQWNDLVTRLDKVMTNLESWTEKASEEDLAKAAPMLANISSHNAYHTGQILYVRKLQGSWNPKNGVS